MNIEIQIKIGELVIGYDEARELYWKLKTVFGSTTEKPIAITPLCRSHDNPSVIESTHGPMLAPLGQPIPIGTLPTSEGAVAVLKDSYVPPPGQVDSGTLCP